jgi:hypothetical protein
MFTKEELSALHNFLERVNLNGKEADALVYLKNKIKAEKEKAAKSEVVEAVPNKKKK